MVSFRAASLVTRSSFSESFSAFMAAMRSSADFILAWASWRSFTSSDTCLNNTKSNEHNYLILHFSSVKWGVQTTNGLLLSQTFQIIKINDYWTKHTQKRWLHIPTCKFNTKLNRQIFTLETKGENSSLLTIFLHPDLHHHLNSMD